ncbi:MAG: hypothetical protein J6M60_01355 [Clostridia bacterium]|nr:hypothetical protein [Clostridia bacterium]
MVKRSLRAAEGLFAVIGAVCTMCFLIGCLMPEVTAKAEGEDDDYDEYIDPQIDDDDDDDEIPDDDRK